MVYSTREEIKDCSRQLDESFQLFMVSIRHHCGCLRSDYSQNSVTSFIAHQAVLLRNDVARMQTCADEKSKCRVHHTLN
jgi:hypothetical protein